MNYGCGRKLADEWWQFCGETDMGQSMPALCEECEKDGYKLKVPHEQYGNMTRERLDRSTENKLLSNKLWDEFTRRATFETPLPDLKKNKNSAPD